MLETLRGSVNRKDIDEAVIEVGGIGFCLSIPASTCAALPEPGEQALLYTHLVFNQQEGEFALYGFATEVEREVFRIFLTISGIGPRKGLMILSQIRIGEFARAIRDRNLAYLSQIKGVGRKTAERLLVELREKMIPYVSSGSTTELPGGEGESVGEVTLPVGENISDAVAGLISLGCRYSQAARAVSKAVDVVGAQSPTPVLLKEALKHR